ncbi:hypothetical protein MRB53_010998 [Persea americana]|uniref:Uncharacterized protein n=1 Tax=Persea americana TaxID=3435 RepID=A0ACC2LTA6_PERAE|nr:hypothetical protein MRB53_010998 [Persea americana]
MEPTKIAVKDDESVGTLKSAKQASETYESSVIARDVPTLIPVEEIASLEPGQQQSKFFRFVFITTCYPALKLAVFCHGKNYLVKLRPDIGYFIKPLSLVLDVFMDKELQLRGINVRIH